MRTTPVGISGNRRGIRQFGIVEQLQVVASTAVVVAMITIISINVFSGQELTYIDLLTVITVGLFGFISVYFSVKYGRKLEEQRRELLAINTISEAVSNSVRPNVILKNALKTVVGLLDADYGWIYLNTGTELRLEYTEGAKVDIVKEYEKTLGREPDWSKQIVRWERLRQEGKSVPPSLKERGVQIWISQPLETSEGFAGLLILAGKDLRKFDDKQMNLLSIIVSQIDVALDNAHLFEKLNESKKLYADLYEHSPDMYHIIDRDGYIVSCNQTEEDVLGYSREELIGMHVKSIYPESYHRKVDQRLKQIFSGGANLTGVEEQIRKKDGSLLSVSLNTSLIYKNRNPDRVRVVMRDVTETKMMQEKLLQIQRIDSLGNLAGGIAHDFNNILVSILSAASIMKRKMQREDPWFDYVEMIEAASRRGGALTRQLLTFARQSNVTFHPIDVNEVIRETVRLMERSLDKSIVLRTQLTEEFAVIEGDDRQLQQVLMNLLLNSRDAMPEGGIITLSTTMETLGGEEILSPLATDGKYVILTVEDTGIGMDGELMKKIFEPFFTTKEAGKGTGLGLSVVYGIVNKHKGFITVDSKEKEGATFKIFLPQFDLQAQRPSKEKRSREAVNGGAERIVVIEDESPVGRMIHDMLSDFGYSITLFNSGEKGLAELTANGQKYDLLILDLNMPKIGGREVLQKLRMINDTIPVIISTGYGDQVLDEQNIRELTQGYIQKPYDEYEIGRVVRRVLDEYRQPAR
jgi:two-component system, cell cycle sensor histidine kinase and response regulator CckA